MTEKARARVFVFLSLQIFLALAALLFEESDRWLFAADDILIALAALFVLFLFWRWRGITEEHSLVKQNNYAVFFYFLALAVQIVFLPIEFGDRTDFGNEIPTMIFLLLGIANRYL